MNTYNENNVINIKTNKNSNKDLIMHYGLTNRYNGPDVMLQFKDSWSLIAGSAFFMPSETSQVQIVKSSKNAGW